MFKICICFLIIFVHSPCFSKEKSEISIMTWNLFLIPKPFNFTQQEFRTEKIAEALKKTNHDILFFQEVFINDSKDKLQKAMSETHPYSARLDRKDSFLKILDSGLLVLSKYPFKIINSNYFEDCTHTDCFSSKGFLHLEFNLPNQKIIQVITTHLQAWDDPKASESRSKQLAEIHQSFQKHKKPNVPQLLIGDLNIDATKGSDVTNFLKILEMKNEPLIGKKNYSTGFQIDCYNKPGDNSKQWIDHIWVNPFTSAVKVETRQIKEFNTVFPSEKFCSLSDHYAVEGRIKWAL
jgi:endonuclease/exonuclease/phosphatase family metal-dependent hydrolase